MYYTIYETTNLITGMKYRGAHKTCDPNDGYLGSGKLLLRAIEKHGEHNFEKKVIFFSIDVDSMYWAESILVDDMWVNRKDTYNLKKGGDGGWDYINSNKLWLNRPPRIKGVIKYTDEQKANVSRGRTGILKGVPQTDKHKENRRLSKCNSYIVHDPNGKRYEVNDLPTFCRDHNLAYKTLVKLPLNGRFPKRGSCSGWRCDII